MADESYVRRSNHDSHTECWDCSLVLIHYQCNKRIYCEISVAKYEIESTIYERVKPQRMNIEMTNQVLCVRNTYGLVIFVDE